MIQFICACLGITSRLPDRTGEQGDIRKTLQFDPVTLPRIAKQKIDLPVPGRKLREDEGLELPQEAFKPCIESGRSKRNSTFSLV